MPAEARRFWASDAETVLAPTRKASFQGSNSMLQAKSFLAFLQTCLFKPFVSGHVYTSQPKDSHCYSSRVWKPMRSTRSPASRTRSHVALVVFLLAFQTDVCKWATVFAYFFRACCNDCLGAQIFCRKFNAARNADFSLRSFQSSFSSCAEAFSNQKRSVTWSIWSFVTGFEAIARTSVYKGNIASAHG